MEENIQLQTITWLQQQIDAINAKATLIGEMLMEENNRELIEILDKKLAELEHECNILGQKLEVEQKIFTKSL
jgi:hypothetical protein